MINGLCHFGNWGSLGNLGGWGWVGLIAGLTLLVVWAILRARVPAAAVPHAARQPYAGKQNTAKEILEAQYARGEITRDQYELKKQDVE